MIRYYASTCVCTLSLVHARNLRVPRVNVNHARKRAHGRALINGRSANEVSMYTSRTGSARQALSISCFFVLQPSAE